MPSYFTISKSYFTNYTIPFYKTSNNPKFFFFPFYLNILFYSFFFYYFSFSIPFPLFLPQPLTPVSTHRTTHTQRSMIHQSTYPNPSPHTHKHKLSNHQLSHTHKPFKPIRANNSHHTHQSKPATTTTWSRAWQSWNHHGWEQPDHQMGRRWLCCGWDRCASTASGGRVPEITVAQKLPLKEIWFMRVSFWSERFGSWEFRFIGTILFFWFVAFDLIKEEGNSELIFSIKILL